MGEHLDKGVPAASIVELAEDCILEVLDNSIDRRLILSDLSLVYLVVWFNLWVSDHLTSHFLQDRGCDYHETQRRLEIPIGDTDDIFELWSNYPVENCSTL